MYHVLTSFTLTLTTRNKNANALVGRGEKETQLFARDYSNMPSRMTALEALASAIPKAFEQAQNSSANHQKNFIALHKIHLDAAAKTETIRDGDGIKLVGERAFEDCFINMVNRVVVVKKGIGVADRSIKFVAGYIKFLNVKGAYQWLTSVAFVSNIHLFNCPRRPKERGICR